MTGTNVHTLCIKSQKGKRLSKEQVRFNKLVKQIEQLDARTTIIEKNLQIARLVYNVTLQPLINKWLQLKIKRLQVLDEVIETGNNATINADRARQLLLKEAKELADQYNHHIAKELFDKYNATSFSALKRESLEALMQQAKEHLEAVGMAFPKNEVAAATSVPAITEAGNSEIITPGPTNALQKRVFLQLVQEYHPDKLNGNSDSESEKVIREANDAYRSNAFYRLLKLEKQYLQKEPEQLTVKELKEYNTLLEEDLKAYNLRLAVAENKYGPAFFEKFGIGGSRLKTALENEKIVLTWKLQQLENNWNDFRSQEKLKNYLLQNNYVFAET